MLKRITALLFVAFFVTTMALFATPALAKDTSEEPALVPELTREEIRLQSISIELRNLNEQIKWTNTELQRLSNLLIIVSEKRQAFLLRQQDLTNEAQTLSRKISEDTSDGDDADVEDGGKNRGKKK